jgi:exonuclease SbcC
MEKHVMVQVHREFNSLFEEWFDVLLNDENVSVRLDDEFTPIVMQNGYEIDIANMSGGEKTAIALAYRLALNRVINDLVTTITTKDLLILDEPTDGFSTEQLDRMRDVLDKLNLNQVIIVSHESKIESFVNTIIRISKNEHVSTVV